MRDIIAFNKHKLQKLDFGGRSDNLKVLQQVNKCHEAKKQLEEIGTSLEQVFDLLKRFKQSSVYYIYEEANFKANHLAKNLAHTKPILEIKILINYIYVLPFFENCW